MFRFCLPLAEFQLLVTSAWEGSGSRADSQEGELCEVRIVLLNFDYQLDTVEGNLEKESH